MNATTLEIQEEISKASHVEPHWLKIGDAVVFSGMCRSKIYALVKRGKIRSACLRDPDNVRGTRVINAKSLNDYIESCEGVWSEQVPDKKNGGGGVQPAAAGKSELREIRE
jgi:Helix-turn-helix domain